VLDVLPGNAAEVMLGESATPESLAALTAKLGLDRPPLVRYVDWMKGLATGELGISTAYDTPITQLIGERLRVTVPLALLAMALTTALAFSLGLFAAARHGRAGDVGIMAVSQVGIAIPNFWFAILLILAFSVKLRWFSAAAFPAGAPRTAAGSGRRCVRWCCRRWRWRWCRRRSWPASSVLPCSRCCARTSSALPGPRGRRRAACSGATCCATRWCRW
jgi:peptide/nickel transport system permease protein